MFESRSGHQAGHGMLPPAHNDLFALFHFMEESREVRLCFMDSDYHGFIVD